MEYLTLYAWHPKKEGSGKSYAIRAYSIEEAKDSLWDYLTANNLADGHPTVHHWVGNTLSSWDQEHELDDDKMVLISS